MKRSIDEPSGYLARLKPMYVRLFRIAHAIVGNLELSEYVLRSAIVEAYLRRGEWQGRMGFQESLMFTVRTVALVELKGMRAAGSFEIDWVFPSPQTLEMGAEQALYARLMRDSDAMTRIALLQYGCDMTVRQIAAVMDMRPQEVSARLRRLRSRLSRAVKLKGRRGMLELDHQMESLMRAALERPGADVAEMGAVFRSFERDVEGAKKPRMSTGRVVATVIKVAGAVVLAAGFWLMAVLMQPSTAPRSAPLPTPETAMTEFATQS